MHELKPISRQAIAAALARAERYRLLNEPGEAESICRDVLAAEPGNQEAIIMLILAMTDQFARSATRGVAPARELAQGLRDPYERLYYSGVISERWGKAEMRRTAAGGVSQEWLREAMRLFEQAMEVSPPGNEESILRWNACARLLNREEESRGRTPQAPEPRLDDEEIPPR
jgi:hypothetical protein